MRVLFFVLLTAFLAGACTSDAVPADIIARPKMETILWQLMQSDEYVRARLLKDSTKAAHIEKMKIYQQVFDLNGTSLEAFRKSYRYYMSHPDITKVMFDSIAARAGKQKSEMYKPALNDTLKPKLPAIPVKADSGKLKPVLLLPGKGPLALEPLAAKHPPGRFKLKLKHTKQLPQKATMPVLQKPTHP